VQSLSVQPDFLIVGAQKSGTSSLHRLLAMHPDVFIPQREVFFFDIDDREQHPDFYGDGGAPHNFERDFSLYDAWYASFFADARPGQVLGEDSTSYLPSKSVPARLARLCPDVKVIALLRDPVRRAYSQYWHDVSRSRIGRPFDQVIHGEVGQLIARGFYVEQLQRYYDALPAEQIKVIVFEEYRADIQAGTQDVCTFLGVSQLPAGAFSQTHYNAAYVPLHAGTRLRMNRLLGRFTQKTYKGLVPHSNHQAGPLGRLVQHAWDHPVTKRVDAKLQALRARRRYPPMTPAAQRHLSDVYRDANADLGALIGRDDLGTFWPYMAL
jgi:hypothetical protein